MVSALRQGQQLIDDFYKRRPAYIGRREHRKDLLILALDPAGHQPCLLGAVRVPRMCGHKAKPRGINPACSCRVKVHVAVWLPVPDVIDRNGPLDEIQDTGA
jgi:hypothetical protein